MVVKRFFDLTVAVAGLIVWAPMLGLISVAIKLSSGGPVLFKQERIGRQGRMFQIIKFRSMVRHAPDLRHPDGSTYSADRDLRVTRLGRFLRRTSLDELPQLWNVVRGEMSLVGPRPELAEGILTYRPNDFKRLQVRPGMTGWAVVHGRNEVPISVRRDLDAWYADHAGFVLDLKILCKTIATVVERKGINRRRGQPETQRCSTEN
ncbi:MAG: sugar transferase [Acidobacteriaceae bacterium]|jgi:lipopolysaccharide/colanic/teichoic acid biosynthesis glycosyltransferase